jgi:hypothetical protein
MLKGKTPEAIRKLFHIENDLTHEEEEKVRKENEWHGVRRSKISVFVKKSHIFPISPITNME